MNDYDELSAVYQLTDQKPDKKYAMTATVNLMLGYFGDKKILDLGCGSGFFTRQFADKNPQIVIGIDNSIEQIQRAKTRPYPKTHYILGNALTDKLPNSDIVFCPFLINYLEKYDDIQSLFRKIKFTMNFGGVFGGILDMPKSTLHDMREYGSIKRLERLTEGTPMEVELWSGGENTHQILTLNSTYHSKQTIETALGSVGFKNITWHDPIVSNQGVSKFGAKFWDRYYEDCDCAFFTANK